VRKAEPIKPAQLLDIVGFEICKIQVQRQVMTASGQRDKSFQWIIAVEDPNFDYDDFDDCVSLNAIGTKLFVAIFTIVKHDVINREIVYWRKLAARQIIKNIISETACFRIREFITYLLEKKG